MKLIRVNEAYTPIGEVANCFYAFFLLQGDLYSVHRRHRLFSLLSWPADSSEVLSQIVLTRYLNRDASRIASEELLCDGNDPRVVSNGSEAFVLSQGAAHSGIEHYLTRLPSRERVTLSRGPGVPPGKNWQPYLRGTRLCVVDSVAPFRTNRLDPATGIITRDQEFAMDLDLAAAHDGYAVLRGGSNALLAGDVVCGWGHATLREYIHAPYTWKLRDSGPTVSFSNLHSYFRDRGYSLVDPVSFFEWDADHFALSVACSQRDWFHSQWFLNALLIMDRQEYLDDAPVQIEGDAIRSAKFWHGAELESEAAATPRAGGVSNGRRRGWLLRGPRTAMAPGTAGAVELCYASEDRATRRVGEFDLLLNANGAERVVASQSLYGTNGESTRVRLEFDLSRLAGSLAIQARLFARRWSELSGYFFELIHE